MPAQSAWGDAWGDSWGGSWDSQPIFLPGFGGYVYLQDTVVTLLRAADGKVTAAVLEDESLKVTVQMVVIETRAMLSDGAVTRALLEDF